jgi:hypothetical protein
MNIYIGYIWGEKAKENLHTCTKHKLTKKKKIAQ